MAALPVEITKLFKLGKQAPRIDKRTLKLAKYIDLSKLPPPPPVSDWTGGITDWGMMLNDSLGDCTCAATGHMIQAWSKDASGNENTIPDAAVLKAYEDVGGYKPGQPNTDNGASMLDVLNYWRNTGIGGHKILGYVSVDSQNFDVVRIAGQLFGGTYCGVALPNTAQSQVGTLWRVINPFRTNPDSQPGSWGGHAIYSPYFSTPVDHQGSFKAVTWGALQSYTPYWRQCYFDEEYAVLSMDWLNADKAPSGFDLAQLLADLAALR